MKQGKRPTRKQKELIEQQKIGNQHLNPEKWLIRVVSSNKAILIHKDTKKTRELQVEGV